MQIPLRTDIPKLENEPAIKGKGYLQAKINFSRDSLQNHQMYSFSLKRK